MHSRLLLHTPLGPLTIASSDEALVRIDFGRTDPAAPTDPEAYAATAPRAAALLRRAARELEEYFAGRRRSFTLPLAPADTPFQQRVREALGTIPYGETRTYAQIAAAIGNPRAVRAVGGANHRNPLPVVIPCHRVIGADGTLTGYAGGLERKSLLLGLERAHRDHRAERD